MAARSPTLLLTCEHGGHRVPPAHRSRFAGRSALLRSHRGWDPGALLCARSLARALDAPLLTVTTTRLLVDANRSPHNPAVFSSITRTLPAEEKARLLARHHQPHWERVRARIRATRGPILHVGVHSFTPVYQGRVRRLSVGLLYDPGRAGEQRFAIAWQERLATRLPADPVRRNAPYRGRNDGLTTALRRELPPERYRGLELELNQRAIRDPRRRRRLVVALGESLREALAGGH